MSKTKEDLRAEVIAGLKELKKLYSKNINRHLNRVIRQNILKRKLEMYKRATNQKIELIKDHNKLLEEQIKELKNDQSRK